jgi:O-antigen/teichoic acid export membrane protein
MSTLGNRTAILTLSRLANYGLMLVSPIVLVRLLTVQEFGRYREFLLYASILQAFAVFSINESLLYCVPAHPGSPWRIARQTAVLTACSSALVILALVALDVAMGGALVKGYLLPLAAYTLFSINLDFWEYFWLANGRPVPVFIYSVSRLLTRIVVAIVTAAITHDVSKIIWALVALEGVRLLAAAIAMVVLDKSRREPPLADPWRDQLRFCVPSGIASLLSMLSRNLSNVVVARALGAAALAQYAIGRFGEPVVVTVRSSVSAMILPEMVRKGRQSRESPLALWQRATVMNAIFLFPVVVLVVRYAQPLVVTVFGESYRQAALVMQLYMLVVIRECFDFAPALRAINRTRPLVESNVAALAACAVALLVLVPVAGVAGAMAAFVIASFTDAAYLCWRTMRLYGVGPRGIVLWASIGKTSLAAALASVLIVSSAWTDALGFTGIMLAGAAYVAAFALLLLVMRVPEAIVLLDWAKKLMLRGASQARS